MRAAAILLILACGSLSADDALDSDRTHAIQLWLHLDKYVRKLAGCPIRGEFTVADCHLSQGIRDYSEWSKGRMEAMRVYGLTEK